MIEINKIHMGNCIDHMREMENGVIDLTVTSPPYDNLRTYNGYDFDFKPIARELFRVTKKGGVVVWVVGDATVNGSETGTSFRQALFFKEIGFDLQDTMIWLKPNPVPGECLYRYRQAFEYMFVFTKGYPQTFSYLTEKIISSGKMLAPHNRRVNGSIRTDRIEKVKAHPSLFAEEKIRSNVWSYPLGQANDLGHPAQFPERLAADHILSWSNEGDLVYDPFMGSGTVAKMAHKLKRRWIGSEISQEYVTLAEKRLEPYLAQESLF